MGSESKSRSVTDEYVNPDTGEVEAVEPGVDNEPLDTGGWESASAIIWRPEIKDVLEGFYSDVEVFTEGKLETVVNKHYVTDKDNIVYSFVGGSVFDKAVARAKIQKGYPVKITFLGQAECAAGRVNLFDIKFKRV